MHAFKKAKQLYCAKSFSIWNFLHKTKWQIYVWVWFNFNQCFCPKRKADLSKTMSILNFLFFLSRRGHRVEKLWVFIWKLLATIYTVFSWSCMQTYPITGNSALWKKSCRKHEDKFYIWTVSDMLLYALNCQEYRKQIVNKI